MNRSLVLISLILVSFCTQAQTTADRPYKLLWKISGHGLQSPSYLFGTMHVEDNRAFEFSDSVLLKISACDAFALEVHPDSVIQAVFTNLLGGANQRENKFKKILQPNDYLEFDSLMKKRTGYSLDRLKSPAMAEMFLEKKTSKKDKKTFLDAYLYNIARRQGKLILGLENASQQLNLADELMLDTPEEVKEMLLSRLEGDSLVPVTFHTLLELYYKGDIDDIRNYVKKSPPDYYNKLITQRNLGMASMIKKEIHKQSTFIAIGAGHLAGDEGLIQLLRKDGYAVTLVKPTFTGLAKKYTYEEQQEKWYTYQSESGAYRVDMPQKPLAFKIDSLGLTLQTHIDIGTPIFYQTAFIPLSNQFQGQSSGDVLDALENKLKKKNGSREIEKSSKVEIAGLEGRDFFIQSGGTTLKTRLIHRGDVIYLLQVGPTKEVANSAEALKFLSSFQITELRTQPWKDFTNKQGAFTVKMPGEIETQVVKLDDPQSGHYELNIAHTTNLSAQESYLVRYNDFPPGYVSTHDSIFFSSSIESIFSAMDGSNLQVKIVSVDGFTSQDFTFDMSKEALVKGRITLRGNRFYLLLTTSPHGSSSTGVRDFMESFHLIPYQTSALKEFTLKEGVKIKLPGDFIPDSVNTDQEGAGERRVYNAVDKNTGALYMITTKTLSPYKQFTDKESFFENQKEINLEETNSILTKKDISNTTFIGQDLVSSSSIVNTIKHVRTIVYGRQQFEFAAFLPADFEQSNASAEFFNSIQFSSPPEAWNLFSNKTMNILTDINSSDSTVQAEASNAIGNHTFEKSALPEIYKALSHTYPDDQVEYGSTRNELLRVLRKIHDDTTLPFIKELYSTFPDSAHQKDGALAVLAELKTKEATRTLADFLREEKQTDLSGYSITRPYYDSLELLNYILPELLERVSHFSYPGAIFDIIQMALDSNALTSEVNHSVIEAILQCAKKERPTPDTESDAYYYEIQFQEGLASVLGSIPFTPEVKDLLIGLQKKGKTGTKLIATITLLKNSIKPDPRESEKIAADPSYRTSFYEQLKEIKQEKNFPSKYLTQEKFAESYLYQYMDGEDGAPEKMELLDTRFVKYSGEKQKIYIYKYYYESEEDPEWYYAISGPFTLTKGNLISSDELTYNSYEIYDKSKKLNDVLSILLEGFDAEIVK